MAGPLPPNAICAWFFHDGDSTPQQLSAPCDKEVQIRVRFPRPTIVTVDVSSPDQMIQRASAEILVRDLLIAGIGDSIAAGEGNPDRAIALDDGGFCYRRFGGGGEYFRPGRAGYRGDKACDRDRPQNSPRLGFDREWAASAHAG